MIWAAVLVALGTAEAGPPLLPLDAGAGGAVGRADEVASFREFVARRPPRPDGDGIVLDVRRLPIVESLAKRGWTIADRNAGRWEFRQRDRSLFVELEALGPEDDPECAWKRTVSPHINMRTVFRQGPAELGEFSVEESLGEEGPSCAVHWVNRNIFATIFGFQAIQGPVLLELAHEVDRWLGQQVVPDLARHVPKIETLTVAPSTVVTGDAIRLAWAPAPDPERVTIEIDTDRDGPSLSRLDVGANEARVVTLEPGTVRFRVRLFDTRSLLRSERAIAAEVFDFEKRYGATSAAELKKLLDPGQPELVKAIALRLLDDPEAHAEELACVYEWSAGDPAWRQALVEAFWKSKAARVLLLREPTFQRDLTAGLQRLPFVLPVDRGANDDPDPLVATVRAVIPELLELGLGNTAAQIARGLPLETLFKTWKTVAPIFNTRGDFDGAIALLERMLRGTPQDAPERILLESNLAVELMLKGDRPTARFHLESAVRRPWTAKDLLPRSSLSELQARSSREAAAQRAYQLRTYLGMAYHNTACLEALGGASDLAIAALNKARKLAEENYPAEKLRDDPDLAALRSIPEFRRLIGAR